MNPIRVLVVDDSALIRRILRDMISAEADIEVVGSASDGEQGARMVEQLRPDVVTMDVEMPNLSGLEALKRIMSRTPVPVIMVSSLTFGGAHETIEALHSGAFDFVCKPNNGSPAAIRTVREDLLAKIRHARGARVSSHAAHPPRAVPTPRDASDRIVLIASSTGGPRALTAVFETLPKNFPAPIVIVQHMPATFTASLAKRLDQIGTVPCCESETGMTVQPGRAIIARGGEHLVFDANGRLALSHEPPVHGVRPAADLLFCTAAERFGARCLGVVLTGMGRDGASGAQAIKRAGGFVIVESEETCAVYGMPKSVVQANAADVQAPIGSIAAAICDELSFRGTRAA